ncbi:MAG: Mur ligase family protein, partial [Pseudomonadota bacterium]
MKSRETAQRTLILGGGLSGDATLRYLQQRDDLVVVDTRLDVAEQLAKQYPEVRVRQISEPASLTELLLRPERGFDRAVVSPGLSDEHPLVRALLDAAIPITTDIDLFCTAVQVPVIGCTGTNGKSTVTALIEELLKGQGVRALAGGNLGPAALDLLRQDPDVAVLELSSFQLQRAGPLPLGIALFLNLADDHVDYHGSYAAYQRAKLRIFEAASCRVWNRDDPATQYPPQADGVMSFGLGPLANDEQGAGIDRSPDGTERLIVRCGERLLPLLPVRLLGLPGRHNLA